MMFVILPFTDSCSAMHLLNTGFQAHDHKKNKKGQKTPPSQKNQTNPNQQKKPSVYFLGERCLWENN